MWLEHHNVNTRDYAGYDLTPYDICGADVTNPAKPVYFTIAEQAGRCPPYPYNDFDSARTDMLDISGNIVVWESNGDILRGGHLRPGSHQDVPNLHRAGATVRSGDLRPPVVWTDERDDIGDIYGADISNPEAIREFKVFVGPGWQLQPDIDGTLIVFSDGSESGGEICACSISREYGIVPFALPPLEGEDYSWYYGIGPTVDGTTITWWRSERIQSLSLEFAYEVARGPVQNLGTGTSYDYIQHAIDAAAAGDTIVAQEGTYPEKLIFRGKDVTVTSTNPQDRRVRAATVIEGSGQLVTFADGEDSNSVLSGFTVSGGSFGVYCGASSPMISDFAIVNNVCAGIKLWDQATPAITHSEITGNGTGVEMWEQRGGRFTRVNRATLQNCLIAGNRKDGIWGGRPTMQNCTIAENLGYGVNSMLLNANSSIIYFNNAGGQNLKVDATSVLTYSDIQGGWPGEGNIDADPLFVASGHWANPANRTASPNPGDPGVKWIAATIISRAKAGHGMWPRGSGPRTM